jgi:hypothetical protein
MSLRIVALALVATFGCAASKAIETDKDYRETIHNATLEELADGIELAVIDAPLSVRVYYRGNCGLEQKPLPEIPLPRIDLKLPPKGDSNIERVRSIFRNIDSVQVIEDEGKIIRVRLGNPDERILLTEISLLTFTPDEQYNRRLAIKVIDGAPEVLEAAARLGLQQTLGPVFGLLATPDESLPSLPPTIENVNMDEALDLVAITFQSNVTFGACATQYMVEDFGKLDPSNNQTR